MLNEPRRSLQEVNKNATKLSGIWKHSITNLLALPGLSYRETAVNIKRGQIWKSPSFSQEILFSPNLSMSYKLWRAGMHSAPSIYPKSVVYLTTTYLPVYVALPVGCRFSKNGLVEKNFHGEDAFPRVILAKISCLFDNNLSPCVGSAPSQQPKSQKRRCTKFFRRHSWVQHI
jgi:hypothetical protein